MKIIPHLKRFIKYEMPWWQAEQCLRSGMGGRKGRRQIIKWVYNQPEFRVYAAAQESDFILWRFCDPILAALTRALKRGNRK